MNLDPRIPIGLVFTLVGIILAAFGAATRTDTGMYARSLGVNVNLWWGVVLFVFGQLMFQLGRHRQKQLASLLPPGKQPDPNRTLSKTNKKSRKRS